jgi:hypothetical protein
MNNREHHAHLFAKFQKQAQQSNRVGAPRDGDPNAISGRQQLVFPDIRE